MILSKCSPLSGSTLDYPGQACRVSTLLPKHPPFPMLADAGCNVHFGGQPRAYGTLCLGLSVPRTRGQQHWDGVGRCLRASWACLPELLVLPWLSSKPSPPPYPPAPHPQIRPFQGPRLLGVMETVSRHPQRSSSLAGQACRQRSPLGSLLGARTGFLHGPQAHEVGCPVGNLDF